jgi:D-alanine--poly(phosphoribitol) ligase subunit 1
VTNLWNTFSAQVDTQPDAAALMFNNDIISFAELRALSLRCATTLTARGVLPGHVVALQLPKRPITYALLLGCLRLGVPYVFIDPKNPAQRTASIVERVRPRLLFTEEDTANPFGDVITLSKGDGQRWLTDSSGAQSLVSDATGTDPAYVMFTSGSTGEPKGAVIPHQGVLSLMQWARELFYDSPAQRFTGINPLHFDNSVFDTYCGLLNGAALVPIETGEISNPATWTKMARTAKATVMFAVPTLFLVLDQLGLLTPKSLPDVRKFVFGGEGYPIAKLRAFHSRFDGGAQLINVYGPTETSCICSSLLLTPAHLTATDGEFPPLGRMHRNFSHLVLNEDQRPVTAGERGELWIGGPCVGLGYYRNAEETAARFRQDPTQDSYRATFYRTGDLVRRDADGQLWFHGRVDNQVKIRGYRIELEEIDLAVEGIPEVSRAVAVFLPNDDGGEIVVAFAADRTVPKDEVLAQCTHKLPTYMRPAKVVQLDKLPHNANGKVDRRAAKSLLAQADCT